MFNPNEWKQDGDRIVAGCDVIAEGVKEGDGLLMIAAPMLYEFVNDVANGATGPGRAAYARRLVRMADGTGPAVPFGYAAFDNY